MTATTRPAGAGLSTIESGSSRRLLPFVAFALPVGGGFLALSTIFTPDAPFLLAAMLIGLALPALVLTHRDHGRAGVRALLRDCTRLPSSSTWLLVAALAIPAAAWTTGQVVGGARELDWELAGFYVADLLIGAVVINIWEEMAWTGFFQRRADARWGVVGGSLVTSAFFTLIHLPLALEGAGTLREASTNVLTVAGLAVGIRLLIARIDPWSGGSLLTIGILHSSFNATESLLNPEYDWVRVVTTIVLGIGVIAFGRQDHGGTR